MLRLCLHVLWFYYMIGCALAAKETLIAECDSVCVCTDLKNSFGVEFRVICNGDGTKHLNVGESLLQNEGKPDFLRRIYVKLNNFTSAFIAEEFLVKWLTYSSSSFDIWNAGKVAFPYEIAATKSFNSFTGIGIKNCVIDSLPKNVFKQNAYIGLKFINSYINSLDLFSLRPINFNYLIIKNTFIQTFVGNSKKAIMLETHLSKGSPEILITNSTIAYLDAMSLYFDSKETAKISIINTYIGILKNSSIVIGKHLSFNITHSSFGYVYPAFILFKDKPIAKSLITESKLGLQKGSMKYLICDSTIDIKNNLIVPSDVSVSCQLNETKNEESTCKENFLIDNYLDSSCKNNYVLGSTYYFRETEHYKQNKTIEKEQMISLTIPTQFIETTTETITIDNEKSPIILNQTNIQNNSYTKDHFLSDTNKIVGLGNSIPNKLFFLLIGILAFLLIVILGLIFFIVFGTERKRKKSPKQNYTSPTSIRDEEMQFFSGNNSVVTF